MNSFIPLKNNLKELRLFHYFISDTWFS